MSTAGPSLNGLADRVCCIAGELSPALAWLLVMGLAAAGLAITSAPRSLLRPHGHTSLVLRRSMVAFLVSLLMSTNQPLPCRHELRFAHHGAVRPGPVPGDHLQRAAAAPQEVPLLPFTTENFQPFRAVYSCCIRKQAVTRRPRHAGDTQNLDDHRPLHSKSKLTGHVIARLITRAGSRCPRSSSSRRCGACCSTSACTTRRARLWGSPSSSGARPSGACPSRHMHGQERYVARRASVERRQSSADNVTLGSTASMKLELSSVSSNIPTHVLPQQQTRVHRLSALPMPSNVVMMHGTWGLYQTLLVARWRHLPYQLTDHASDGPQRSISSPKLS